MTPLPLSATAIGATSSATPRSMMCRKLLPKAVVGLSRIVQKSLFLRQEVAQSKRTRTWINVIKCFTEEHPCSVVTYSMSGELSGRFAPSSSATYKLTDHQLVSEVPQRAVDEDLN